MLCTSNPLNIEVLSPFNYVSGFEQKTFEKVERNNKYAFRTQPGYLFKVPRISTIQKDSNMFRLPIVYITFQPKHNNNKKILLGTNLAIDLFFDPIYPTTKFCIRFKTQNLSYKIQRSLKEYCKAEPLFSACVRFE